MVAYAFNSQQFSPEYGGGSQLPPGMYKGVIVDSRKEDTAKGGGMLVFDIAVIEGPHKDQVQTDRLNLLHSNPMTVKIANNQLAAYCAVTACLMFNDTAELHNKPFQFKVDWQKDKASGTRSPESKFTEIVALADMNGNAPGKSGAVAQPVNNAPPPPQQPAADVAPSTPSPSAWGQPAATSEAPKPAVGGWNNK